MKRETVEKIIKAFKCTSKDATRIHLQHVLINSKEIVATDGHKLVVLKHDDKEIFSKEYLVSPEDIFLLKIILKTYSKYADEMIHSIGENSITINGSNKFSFVTIKTAESLGLKYPNYNQLIPAAITERVKIAFDAKYILQIAETISSGDKHRGVVLEIEVERDKKGITGLKRLNPLLVKSNSQDFAVLCPMRL